MIAAGWGAAGGQTATGAWQIIVFAAPIVFTGVLSFFILRAIIRNRRYRAVGVLGEEDLNAVHQAVVAAERKTVGEILPVVVERSDPHPGAGTAGRRPRRSMGRRTP